MGMRKPKVMRISRQPSPLWIMIDDKQLQNMEYFNCLDSTIRNGASEIKCKAENSKVLHFEHSLVRCWKLDTLESRSEIPGKFWNVMLEKKEDHLDRSCEEQSIRYETMWKGMSYIHYKRARLIRLVILYDYCLKHVSGVKKYIRMKVTVRRGTRRKQLLDKLKEKKGCWKLKEEAIDRNLQKTRYRRG